MTSAELIENFSILQDKRGSSNFDDTEALVFLNHAQLERLKRLIPDDQGAQVNLDLDQNTLMNVRPLIYSVSTNMNSSGVITFATVNTALQSGSGDAGCKVHRILGMSWTLGGESYPVKYTKTNNWDSYKRNVFKKAVSDAPRYKVDATNIMIDPVSTTATIAINCLKTPKILTAANSPDWDDSNANLIIEIALQLAAQATRDQELLQTIQNSNVAK